VWINDKRRLLLKGEARQAVKVRVRAKKKKKLGVEGNVPCSCLSQKEKNSRKKGGSEYNRVQELKSKSKRGGEKRGLLMEHKKGKNTNFEDAETTRVEGEGVNWGNKDLFDEPTTT